MQYFSKIRKVKFRYNPETCRYEPITLSKRKLVLRVMIGVTILLAASFALNDSYYRTYAKYQKEMTLKKENESLKLYYDLLQEDMEKLNATLDHLQIRDDEIYRTIFEVDPIDRTIRQAGVGGRERYQNIYTKNIDAQDIVIAALKKAEQMKNQALIQEKSYEELVEVAAKKSERNAHIPAIQPISNQKLYRLSSGYGTRIDPIYKIRKFHPGIDFSAPKGTPVYATGGGKVVKVLSRRSGYGNTIVIDHGYGFRTLYAHLHSFKVKVGSIVKRGDLIAYVGNTGKSTAPHLHYEVHQNRKKLNPIHFFFKDITEEAYAELLRRASIENQSLE